VKSNVNSNNPYFVNEESSGVASPYHFTAVETYGTSNLNQLTIGLRISSLVRIIAG